MREERRWIETRFRSQCCDCGDLICRGMLVLWFPKRRNVMCQTCGEENYGG